MTVAGAPIMSSALFGGILAGAATAITENVQRANARRAAEDLCMRGQGYVRLELTTEEAASLNGAGAADAKHAWTASFLAKDQAERIAAAQAAQPALLPQLQDQPFAVEGVQLDAAGLQLFPGSLGSGAVVMKAVASHRRTATLVSDVQADGMVHLRFTAGTVLHAVDASGTTAMVQTTLWCGPMIGRVFGKDHDRTGCLLSTEKGDAALLAEPSPPWLVAPDLLMRQIRPMPISSGKVELTPGQADLIGPMDVVMTVDDIDEDAVRLRATATRDGKSVRFWFKILYFDKSGYAVLPFWTKRMSFTRAKDKVLVAVSDDGNGAGWLDAPSAP